MRPVERAVEIARRVHAGQVDKAGAPYIEHPLRVMRAMNTDAERVVAVLHDAVEDTPLTLEDLSREGFDAVIVDAIDAITKRPGEDYETYLGRVTGNPIALRVKIADMTDNMDLGRIASPQPKDHERLAKYAAILPRLLAAAQELEP